LMNANMLEQGSIISIKYEVSYYWTKLKMSDI
jgi:hypothetical protein